VALAIPPAWTEVWISPHANAHIQATGVDAAGRVQYIYHAHWRERMDAQKFDRMLELAAALPNARRSATRDLRADGASRERVLAGAFRLLDASSVRPGAEQYTDAHGSFGLTTLLNLHATVHEHTSVELTFPGKSAQPWNSVVDDPDLAALIEFLKRRGPRARLFAWQDGDGTWHSLTGAELNDDVRSRTGGDFTSKDFRTLTGTGIAALSLARAGVQSSEASRKKAVALAMRDAAAELGNTPAIARKSYVDPRVIDLFTSGVLIDTNGDVTIESRLVALLGG